MYITRCSCTGCVMSCTQYYRVCVCVYRKGCVNSALPVVAPFSSSACTQSINIRNFHCQSNCLFLCQSFTRPARPPLRRAKYLLVGRKCVRIFTLRYHIHRKRKHIFSNRRLKRQLCDGGTARFFEMNFHYIHVPNRTSLVGDTNFLEVHTSTLHVTAGGIHVYFSAVIDASRM